MTLLHILKEKLVSINIDNIECVILPHWTVFLLFTELDAFSIPATLLIVLV